MTMDVEMKTTDPPGSPTKKPPMNRYALSCALLASMTSVLLGYDIGVMSGANIFIQKDLKLSDVEVEIVSGILSLYSLIGAFAAGRTSDYLGRRMAILIAGAFFFSGSVFMGLAKNYALLMVGRFIAGIGVGFGMMVAPCYTAEVSPASARGLLTSLGEVFINVGILLGYVSNFAFSKLRLDLGWRFMLGIGIIPSIFIMLGILVMPESPRWLVMQGRIGDAKKVLDKTSDSKEEAILRLADIKATAGIPEDCNDDVVKVSESQSRGGGVYKELLWKPTRAVRHIVVALIGINFFQQIIGIDAVVLYSPRIFAKAGITSHDKQLLCTVAVGIIKTMFILVATFTLDKIGRRPLLLSTIFAMFVSLCCLGTGLTVVDRSGKTVMWAIGVSITAVLAYVASFSVGVGPVNWVYCSEILPLRLRAQGLGLGVAVNRTFSGTISMTFLTLSKALTTGGAFFLFAGITVVAWVFVFFLLPETRGKNLEETEKLFGDLNWKKKERQSASANAANATI
uniref:Major facilitator superfamily (MFS) profile domain-containing protein n=1 Tax=Kalanchoe fedtschenkoi TaxID=63787 RepID=A0A7N0ZZA5_KALFE